MRAVFDYHVDFVEKLSPNFLLKCKMPSNRIAKYRCIIHERATSTNIVHAVGNISFQCFTVFHLCSSITYCPLARLRNSDWDALRGTSSVREEDCSAAVQCGLHRAIRALEGAHSALCYFLERLFAQDMSARQQHWWVLCCALLPRHRASKQRVENKLAPQFQLLHCMATSSSGKGIKNVQELVDLYLSLMYDITFPAHWKGSQEPTTGSWEHVWKSWFCPAITVASLSNVGRAMLPAATATSRGLSHACNQGKFFLTLKHFAIRQATSGQNPSDHQQHFLQMDDCCCKVKHATAELMICRGRTWPRSPQHCLANSRATSFHCAGAIRSEYGDEAGLFTKQRQPIRR